MLQMENRCFGQSWLGLGFDGKEQFYKSKASRTQRSHQFKTPEICLRLAAREECVEECLETASNLISHKLWRRMNTNHTQTPLNHIESAFSSLE